MAFNYSGNLYAVGVGNFIAYKGGEYAAMGKVNTETMFEFSASNLDIRGGKRAPLLMRYSHSSEATFSIISAAYNPNIWKASMGGEDRNYANLPAEETKTMSTRTITLDKTPVAVGDIGSQVWIQYNGVMYGAIDASTTTVVIPSSGAFAGIPDGSIVCATYNYTNFNATSITIPAELNPDVWHIFIDVDLSTDKSGSGIIGRTVVEIPLGKLDPAQTFNATIDGYSESKITGIMLADRNSAGCNSKGIYAYLNTEIDDQNWYDNVYRVINDIDNITMSISSSYTIQLVGLEVGGTYKQIYVENYADLTFVFDAGTAVGSTFDDETGIITSSTTAGTMTLVITCPDKTSIPAYTLEIVVEE